MTTQGPFRIAERALLFSGGVRSCWRRRHRAGGDRGDLAGGRAAEIPHVSARASLRAAARRARRRWWRGALVRHRRRARRSVVPAGARREARAAADPRAWQWRTHRYPDPIRGRGCAPPASRCCWWNTRGTAARAATRRKKPSPPPGSPHTTGRRAMRASTPRASSVMGARWAEAPSRSSPRGGRWRRWCWNPRSPASARWCARRAFRAGSWSMNSTRARSLRSIPGPVLILHGTRDQTFPVEHAHSLRAASPHATLHLQVCGHNDCPPQWELVLSFLARNGVLSETVSGDSR